MRKVNAIHLRLIIVFIISAGLALGAFWLKMFLNLQNDNTAPMQRTEPDYFINNFRQFKLKQTGEADYEMSGHKLTHYPDNHSYIVNFPIIESMDEQRRPQITYADWAFAEDENSKIHLHENVVIIRPPTLKDAAFRLNTDYMLFFPDDELMRTDREVFAYQGKATMYGIGMESNNTTRELFLLSRAKVVYPPQQPKNK